MKIFIRVWSFIKKRFVFGAAGFVIGEGVLNSVIAFSAAVFAFSNGFIFLGAGCVLLGFSQLFLPLYLSGKALSVAR